jgi:VWFA-related protein
MPAAAQNLTEKIEVSLVNVDVTVTSHGAPTKGLTRDDFEIREDGVPQTITHFYAIENAREKVATTEGTPSTPTTSPQVVDERFRRRVLVVIDNRHISRHNRDVALKKLEQFIDEHFDSGAYDWSISMISDGAHLLLAPTSDKARIHAALGQIRAAMAGRAMRDTYHVENRVAQSVGSDRSVESIGLIDSGGPSVNTLIERGNYFLSSADTISTFRAIRDVTHAFSTQSGRKIVLLITGTIGDQGQSPIEALDPMLSSSSAAGIETAREWLVREANISNISFYVINAEGITPNNIGADAHGPDDAFSPFSSSPGGSSALRWIGDETGGRAFMGNFVGSSLRDFDQDSSNFYSLAYTPTHPDDRKYHSITVRLKKPGRYSLSYRRGYSSLPVERQLERAMTASMSVEMQPSSIPLSLTTGSVASEKTDDSVVVPIYAAVAAKELQFVPAGDGSIARVDFFVSVFDDRGALVRATRTIREAHARSGTEGEGNFIESRNVRLRKGVPYRVVVAIHDQVSDAVGIMSQVVRF